MHPFEGEQNLTHMLRVVGCALHRPVEGLPAVDGVSVGPGEQQKQQVRAAVEGRYRGGRGCRSRTCHSPLQVVVFQPHVGVLGVAFGHDGVPQLSGLLHVLAVKALIQSTRSNIRNIPSDI